MRLATFTHEGTTRIGRLEGEELIDLSRAGIPTEMSAFLAAGDSALATANSATGPTVKLNDVELCAPVLRPQKILAIGLNYKDHIDRFLGTNEKTVD